MEFNKVYQMFNSQSYNLTRYHSKIKNVYDKLWCSKHKYTNSYTYNKCYISFKERGKAVRLYKTAKLKYKVISNIDYVYS